MVMAVRHHSAPKEHRNSIGTGLPSKRGHLTPSVYGQDSSVATTWCQEILAKSPIALRFLKAAFNADTDGLAGLQQLAGEPRCFTI